VVYRFAFIELDSFEYVTMVTQDNVRTGIDSSIGYLVFICRQFDGCMAQALVERDYKNIAQRPQLADIIQHGV